MGGRRFTGQRKCRVLQENLREEPFYSILESKYGTALAGEWCCAPRPTTTGSPRTASGDPVLLMERTSYAKADHNQVLFEYIHYAPARVSYRL